MFCMMEAMRAENCNFLVIHSAQSSAGLLLEIIVCLTHEEMVTTDNGLFV